MTNNVAPKRRNRGRLILLDPQAPAQAPPHERKKPFALLIGCGRFGEGLEPLPGALRDVMALYLQLSSGASGYESDDVKVLLDPTLSTLEAELAAVAETLQDPSYGTLLLYISTHGGYDEQGYHLCVSDTHVNADGIAEQAWGFAQLRRWLSPQQQLSQVVLLDTCRATEANDGHQPSSYHQAPRREDLHLDGESWAMLTSSSYGELSWLERRSSHSGQGPHSLFARALLDELKTPRAGEESIEVASLHKHLQARLQRLLHELYPGVTQTSCFLANFQTHPVIASRPHPAHAAAAPPQSSPPEPETTRAKSPWRWAVLAVALLCLAGIGAWWLKAPRPGAFAHVQQRPGMVRPVEPRTPKSDPTPQTKTTPAQARTAATTPPARSQKRRRARRTPPRRRRPRRRRAKKRNRKRRRIARYQSRRTRRSPQRAASTGLKDAVRGVLGKSMGFCHFNWGKALSVNKHCFPIEKMSLLARYASPSAYIESFILTRSDAQDDDLRHLKGFTHTKRLLLSRTRITGAGLRHLRRWQRLQSLALPNTPFHPRHARNLRHFRALQRLILGNTYADDATLRVVGQLRQLRRLQLQNTRIKGRGFQHLKALQRLERLNLCNRSVQQRRQSRVPLYGQNTTLTDHQLSQLPALRSLRVLRLCRMPISMHGLRGLLGRLASFPSLKFIKMYHTRVTSAEARQLREALRAKGIRIRIYAR